MSDVDLDKKIMVIEKATENNPSNNMEGDVRRWTTMREALAELDISKQYSLCKTCGHDIDDHEAIKEYKTKFAGKCLWYKEEDEDKPHCEQYIPGEVKTAKELDEFNESDNAQPET